MLNSLLYIISLEIIQALVKISLKATLLLWMIKNIFPQRMSQILNP